MSRGGSLLAIALLLGACTAGPNYRQPASASLGIPARYASPVTRVISEHPQPRYTDLSDWWRLFDDPLLTRLVAQATVENLEISEAEARLIQARESRVQARDDLLPTLTGSAGATRNFASGGSSSIVVSGANGTSGTVVTTGGTAGSTQLSLGVDARWQVDL